MKILISYFSGTGNTAWVVQRLAERLEALGDSVSAVSSEDVPASDLDPAAYDMVGVACPTHSSFAPSVFAAYLEALPPGDNTPLFAVTTAGYWSGDTAWYVARPLAARGYRPFLYANVVMPNNFFIPYADVLPVPPPHKVPGFLERAERKITRLGERIHNQEPHREGIGLLGRLGGIAQRVSSDAFQSLVLADFFADETCTRCGWCASHCPVDNIALREDGIHFGDACIYCMRCYSFCPARAIQATPRTRRPRFRRYQGPKGQRYPR